MPTGQEQLLLTKDALGSQADEGRRPEPRRDALPQDWKELWKPPGEEPMHLDWLRLQKQSKELAQEVELVDLRDEFGPLVGSVELRDEPVHRWLSYKEGFSPRLLGRVIDRLELVEGLHVVDAFGGVATTALSGLVHPKVGEVRSVEYSPFACFAGQTKLHWPDLDPGRLRKLLKQALAYDSRRAVEVPDLAAFNNEEIFPSDRIRELIRARDHLYDLTGCDDPERDFFLLGLASVVEDLSGAIKDGRALRIKRTRKRRSSSLADAKPEVSVAGTVPRALAGQWSGMLADLDSLALAGKQTADKQAFHLRGDARHLDRVTLYGEEPAFPDGWADLGLFSPPYLNCIDYTEVYKMELWMLKYITNQHEFRETRLGTLRSHPSIRFSESKHFDDIKGDAIELIEGISDWVSSGGGRQEVGPVTKQYFEDMLQVWREQYRVLRDGAYAVCVVANSTFSRRKQDEQRARKEEWRIPLLTDVLLAHLALVAGFKSVQIWEARELRPRNVQAGRARESLVVARKGPGAP